MYVLPCDGIFKNISYSHIKIFLACHIAFLLITFPSNSLRCRLNVLEKLFERCIHVLLIFSIKNELYAVTLTNILPSLIYFVMTENYN